jgi:hypothetical protein
MRAWTTQHARVAPLQDSLLAAVEGQLDLAVHDEDVWNNPSSFFGLGPN